jgi:hypothetical protein
MRRIADGQIVTEPGAYAMSMDWYHAQCCAGPSISSSGLRTIETMSPMDFWAFSELNEHRFEKPETQALALGRAAHAVVLGEEAFDARFIVLPEDAPPRPTVTQRKAAAEGRVSDNYRERLYFWGEFDARAKGKTVLQFSDMEAIVGMSEALMRRPEVAPLMDGEPEVSLIWQDEQTGVWIKSRPDLLPRMGDIHADFKTTADASLRAVMRDISKHGYDMQMALASVGAQKVLGQEIRQAALVFCQKSPPYHVTLVEITEDALHWAKLRLRRAINRFAECLAKGDWPGPVEGIPQYRPPDWQVDAFGAEQAAGLLPKSFDAPFGAIGGGQE